MSDTLEEISFVTTPRVERLMGETFTAKELAEALAVKSHVITEAVGRFGMFLVSDPVTTSQTRQFHYLDVLALTIYLGFSKHFGPEGRKALLSEVSHMLFGDPLSDAEIAERRAETLVAYDRAARTPSGRAKYSGRAFKVHQQRRAEIKRDPFAACPLFWVRNANQNFAIFGCRGFRLVTLLADKQVNGGKISTDMLMRMGAGTWVNATELFARADDRLETIVNRRTEADRIEA